MNNLLRNMLGAAAGAVVLVYSFVFGLFAFVLSVAVVFPSVAEAAKVPVQFDVPEGWADAAAVPKQAEKLTNQTGTVQLEAVGAARQTLNGRGANVAIVSPGNTAPQVYGVYDDAHGSEQDLQRDVWLKVTGGAFSTVCGGAALDWNSAHATFVRGSLFTEIASDATVSEVYGALHKSGDSNNGPSHQPVFKGNALVVVNGKVNGNIAGGASSVHNWEPHLEGNTGVIVKALQASGDSRILGGSVFTGNSSSAARHYGNTSVTVDLPSSAQGTFSREIAGGSYAEKNSNWQIEGNTSVTVNAPASVTFANPIYGATVANGPSAGKADVSGNSTVTLNGGTYTSYVCAGGYGAGCRVQGVAKLSIGGGAVLTSRCHLLTAKNGASVAQSALELGGGANIAAAAEIADFDKVTLTGDVTLGTYRFPKTKLMAVTGPACITLTLSDDEKKNRSVLLFASYKGILPETLTLKVTNPTAGEVWKVMKHPNGSVYVGVPTTHTWNASSADAKWSDGLAGFTPGDDVVFGPGAPQTVHIDALVYCNDMRIDRDVTFFIEASAIGLQIGRITVGPNGRLAFAGKTEDSKIRARYVRFDLFRRPSTGQNADAVALSELALVSDGKRLPGSDIASVTGRPAGTGLDKLKDGNLDSEHKWFVPEDSATLSDYDLCLDAGAGKFFTCDGYQFGISDREARTPSEWRVSVSTDGTHWQLADSQNFLDSQIIDKWTRNAWLEPAFLFPRPVLIDSIRLEGTLVSSHSLGGTLVCTDTAKLELSPDALLHFDGVATGTLQLALAEGDAVTEPRRVLVTPEQPMLKILPPEGADCIVWYENGAYWVKPNVDPPFRATVAGNRRLSELTWTDARGRTVPYKVWSALAKSQRSVELMLGDGASVLAVDTVLPELLSFLVSAEKDASLEVNGAVLTTDALYVRSNVALHLSAQNLVANQASLQGSLELSSGTGTTASLPMSLTGNGTFRKSGDGTLVLMPQPAAEEGRLIDGVTVELAGGLLRLAGSETIPVPQINQATFRFMDADGNSQADGRLESAGWVTSPIMATFTVPEGVKEATAAINLTGIGVVRKNGPGTLTLSLAGPEGEVVPYAGETLLDGGTLRIDARSALTLSGAVSGSGALEFSGAPVTVSAYNTYMGTSRLQPRASVRLLGDASLGRGAVYLSDGATLSAETDADIVLSDVVALSATASLSKTGPGSLMAASVRGGTVALSGGTLGIGPLMDDSPVLTALDGGILTMAFAEGSNVRTLKTTLTEAPATHAFRVVRTPGGPAETPRRTELKNGTLNFVFADDGNVWKNLVGDGKWSTPGNWSMGTVPKPGDEVALSAGVGTLEIDADNVSVSSLIIIGSYRDALVISGKPITVTDSLLANASVKTEASVLRLRESADTSSAFSASVFVGDGATVSVNVASGEWPVSDISGKGRFVKTGAGTLALVANQRLTGGVIRDGLTLEIAEGGLHVLSPDGTDPVLAHVTLAFGDRASRFQASRWLNLAGPLTVSTIGFVELESDSATPISLHGNGFLVKRGAGTFAWTERDCSCHGDIAVSVEEGAIGLIGDNADFGGRISGDGRVQIVRGSLRLSGENTHTGGTEVLAGATLNTTVAGDALGNGPLMGTGTLAVPRNTLPDAALSKRLQQADWKGALLLDYDESQRVVNLNLSNFCNRASAVAVAGTLTGYFYNEDYELGALELRGTLSINNGYSGRIYNFAGGLRGSGLLKTSGGQTTNMLVSGPADRFNGAFDLGGSHSVIFGASTSHRSPGWIIVDNGYATKVAADKTWTATWVYPESTIGGTGKILDKLVFEDGAIIEAASDGFLKHGKRWNAGQCTIKGALTIRFPEGTKLPALNESGRKVLESEVPLVLPDPFVTTVIVGTETVAASATVSADGRSLSVHAVSLYETAVAGGSARWENLTWKLNGTGPAMTFADIADRNHAAFRITAADDVLLQVSEKIACHSLMTAGEGRVTLNFAESMVSRDAYASISALTPLELPLFVAANNVSAFDVSLDALRYGTTAFISRDDTGAKALLSRGSSALNSDVLSVNFADTDRIPDDKKEGYISLAGKYWNQVSTSSDSSPMSLYSAETGTLIPSSVNVRWDSSGFWFYPFTEDYLNKSYLDDNGKDVEIEVTNIPEAWTNASYSIIIYAVTDMESQSFGAKSIAFPNGAGQYGTPTWYTYDSNRHITAEGNSPWGQPTRNRERGFDEGKNIIIVRNITAPAFKLVSPGGWGSPSRGSISAIQLVQTPDNSASLPVDYDAVATGSVKWSELAWKANGVAAETLPDDASTYLTLTGDTILDLEGASPVASVTVNGQGHRLIIRNAGAFAPIWNFSSGLTLEIANPNSDSLPTRVGSWPSRILYTYAYNAGTDGYIALADTVTEFSAGFEGTLRAAANTRTIFSGGTVKPTVYAEDRGVIVFTGDVIVPGITTRRGDMLDGLGIGNGTYIIGGHARVDVNRLLLSDGSAGRTATLELKDDAVLSVNGTSNSDTNGASFILGHWAGPSFLTIRGRARLLAEHAVMLVGLTGAKQTFRMEGGEAHLKGIAISKNAGGTNVFDLTGGRLLLGSEGLKAHGQHRMRLTMGREAALGAFEDCRLDGTGVISPLSIPDGMMTLGGGDGELFLNSNYFFADAFTNLVIRSGGAPVTVQNVKARIRSLRIEEKATLRAVRTSLDVDTLTLGGTLFMDARAVLDAFAFRPEGKTALLSVACGSTMAECGYLSVSEGIPADLSDLFVEMVMNPDRVNEAFPPMVPVIVGPTPGGKPVLRSVSVRNDTTAMNPPEAVYDPAGLIGDGLYLKLSGDGVSKAYDVTLSSRGDHRVRQSTADTYTYQSFIASQPGSRMVIPDGGILLEQAAFRSGSRGASICIRAEGTHPYTLMQGKSYTVSVPITFDLSAWDLSDFVRGAVKDVPVSHCLMASAFTASVDPSHFTLSLARGQIPDGFTAKIAVTADGIYLVVAADRPARSVSVNLTSGTHLLPMEESRFGYWAVPRHDWNQLCDVWISDRLVMAGRGGTPVSAIADNGLPTQIDFQGGVPTVNTAASAEGLTRVFASDRTPRSFALRNLPFNRYRVILTFAADYSGAAYAPIVIAGKTYTMDGSYTRCNIFGNGGTIPADRAWGQTQPAETAAVVGSNTLVTDVLTGADSVSVAMPALSYGDTYAGLAAIQIVEASEPSALPPPRAYTLVLGPGDIGTEVVLTDRLPDWVSATNAALTVSASSQFEGAVTLRLPARFEAESLTFGGMLDRTSLTLLSEDGDTSIGSIDASGLENLTMGIICIATEFRPAARVTRFEKMFDNNSKPYTIGANETLVLADGSDTTTSMDVTPGFLNIDPNSTGILRREYAVQAGAVDFPNVTFAWQRYTFDGVGYDTTSANILVTDGDRIDHPAYFHLSRTSADTPWSYTQTGGEAYYTHPSDSEGGMLICNNAATSGCTANISVSGGLLETTGIWAWQNRTKVNVNLSGTGRLRLGPIGFSAHSASASVRAILSGDAVIETTASVTDAKNSASVSLTLVGGTLRALSGTSEFRVPLDFAAPADKPAVIELPEGGRMKLGATSSGTGAVRVASGTVALTAAKALGDAAVTIASGAALECVGTGRTTGSVTFEPGSSLVATSSGSKTVVLGDRPPVLPADKSSMIFILNGQYYAPDQVKIAGNGLSFGTPAPADATLVWNPAAKTGTWRNGLAGAWWKENKRYVDGASVTFSGTHATVTVLGRVVPASVHLNDTDGFTFAPAAANAAGEIDISAMGAKALNLGTDTTFDVPLITAAPAKALTVNGDGNSYRQLGTRRGDRVTLFAPNSPLNESQQPTWLPDTVNAITIAPHPGEIQELPPGHQAMKGTGTVTLAGGGRVIFPGTVNGANWNGTFRGNFIVTDGSRAEFTMERADHGPGGDGSPYFRDGNGQALWRRISPTGDDVPGFRLRNGATLDVSGCRGLIGSYADADDPRVVNNHPVFIGRNATMRYSYASDDSRMNFIPYGHRFNGDGAVLDCRSCTYLRYGTDMDVAGIGDRGDPTEPTVSPDGSLLTQGIRARIIGSVAIANQDKGDVLRLNVGEGSDLEFAADILRMMKFEKNGPGSLTLTTPEFNDVVTLRVREGALFGRSRMMAFGSEVVLDNDTAIGPGMNLAMLRFNGSNCTLYADISGNSTLFAETVAFDGGNASSYRIRPLGNGPIPPARGRAPIKILSWSNAIGIDSASFSLANTLRAAGYALDVAEDGLYLKESQRWYRDLTDRVPEMHDRQWYVLEWNMHDAWACTNLTVPAEGSGEPTPGEQLAAAPRTDYLPDSSRAVEAIFVVPSAARLPRVPSFRIKLDRETHFSSIRFVREDTLETVTQVAVSYIYVLTRAPLPGPDGTKAYTWVSYLAVEGSVPATVGEPEGVPAGYDTAVRDRTVLLYREASKPSVNISFTDGSEGASSYISATDAPIGAEPFAGVYWSNVSTELSQVGGTQDDFRLYRTSVKINGATRSNDGARTDILSLDYITRGVAADPSRHAGGERLAAVWLPGNAEHAIPDQLLTAGAMDKPFMRSGWHLKLSAVPFRSYDLYLLMAGRTGDRSYSAVRVKTGDSAWKTYTFTDGWAAPVAPAGMRPWPGVGVGPAGSFVSGRNLLHLRIQTETAADLQICSADAREDGGAANGDAANQGLAGLQIVSCDGAVYEKFGANGAWSDATGWKLAKNDGSFLLTSWKNPTPEAPYSADIPVSGISLKVDRFVSVPALRFFGEGRSFTLDGTEPMLQAVTLDFSDVAVNSSVSIPRDIFLNSPQFLLAPGMRISVPESSSTPMVNDWNWGYATDSNGTDASSSVLLHKQFPGDLVITSPMRHGAIIEAGTLWFDSAAAQTNIGTFSGAGTLGKRGSGTLTLTGPFAMTGPVPLHVSGGKLIISSGFDQMGSAGSMIVDGGTLELAKDLKIPDSYPVAEVSNGGVLQVRGDYPKGARINLHMLGNGTADRAENSGRAVGYLFNDLIVSGRNNVINTHSNGYGGAGIGFTNKFQLLPNSELTLGGGDSGFRVFNGWMDIADGATLVTRRPIGRGNWNGYASEQDLMTKAGAGRWRVQHLPSAKGDSAWGIKLDIRGGEVSVETGDSFNPQRGPLPWHVFDGATLSGYSAFNDNVLLTFDSGSILRNGIREDSTRGGLSLQGGKTAFASSPSGDTVHNMIFDLRNSSPLTFNGKGPSVHGNGILRITLEHPEAFRGARRLIKWPQGQAPNAWKKMDNIVSSQVVALDAKFEIRNDADNAGLWIVPAETRYLSQDVFGKWSQKSTWKLKDVPVEFPRYEEVSSAKIVAKSADVRIASDEVESSATEVLPWKMGALVLNTEAHDIRLVRDTDTDGKPVESPLALSSALWKQGAGTATVNVPMIFGGRTAGVSVTVDRGILCFADPVQQMTRTNYDDLSAKVNASAEIASGAILRYTAVTDALRDGCQVFTGPLSGSGIFELEQPAPEEGMPERKTLVELGGAAESTASFRVRRGTLRLSGARNSVSMPAKRRIDVAADGAQLVLASEWAFGGGRDTVLSLLPSAVEDYTPLMVQAGREVARIRGTISLDRSTDTPADARLAAIGGDTMNLDDDITFSIAEGNTLTINANIGSVKDSEKHPTLTKTGKGTLAIIGNYATDADVTVAAGTLRFGNGNVSETAASAATGSLTVKERAILRLADGLNVFDPTDGARLTMHSGSILLLGAEGSEVVNADVTLEDGVTLRLESAATTFPNALLTLGERASLRRNGVIVVDLDVFDIGKIPETLDRLPIISLAADSPVFGAGTFVLGGKKQAEWAKAGWSLEVTRTSVAMVYFGGSSAYTWAGGKDNGNWMSENWSTATAKDEAGNLVATVWPANDGATPEEQYSVKLTDMSPLDGGVYIPAANRTIADNPDKGIRTIRALWANISDDTQTTASGDYTFTAERPDQDLYINGEILKSGSADLIFRRPVRTESEAGALRLFGGTVDFGSSLTSLGRSRNYGLPITFGGGAVLRFSGAGEQTLSGIIDAGEGSGAIERTGRGRLNLDTPIDVLTSLSVTGATVALRQRNLYGLDVPVTLTTAEDNSEASLEIASDYASPGAVCMKVNADAAAPDGVLGWQADFGGISAEQMRLGRPNGLAAERYAYNVKALRYAPKSGHLVLSPVPGILPETAELRLAGGATEATALWLGSENENGRRPLVVGSLTGTGCIGVEPTADNSNAPWRDTRVLTVALESGSETAFGGSFAGAVTADGHAITAGLSLINRNPAGDMATFRYQGISDDSHLGTLAIGPAVNAEVSGTWSGSVSLASGALLSGNGTFGNEHTQFSLVDGATLSASALGSREIENGAIVREVIPTEMNIRGTLKVSADATLKVLVRTDKATKAPWVSCINVDNLVVPSAIADSDAMHFNIVIDVEKGTLGASTKILGWKRHSGLRIGIRPEDITLIRADGDTDTYDFRVEQRGDGLYLVRAKSRFWMIVR